MSFLQQRHFIYSSRAIRSRFGAAIKTKTLTDDFKGISITNTSTHATRVRVSIMKVILPGPCPATVYFSEIVYALHLIVTAYSLAFINPISNFLNIIMR